MRERLDSGRELILSLYTEWKVEMKARAVGMSVWMSGQNSRWFTLILDGSMLGMGLQLASWSCWIWMGKERSMLARSWIVSIE